MSENLELEKQLKLAKRTGSYVVGRREVSGSLKGTKLLVWSASANIPQSILDECRNLSVPAIKFGGNPVELGHACGIPFRVSVIALKTTGDADISNFTKSSDYHSGVVEPEVKHAELKPAKEVAVAEPKTKKEPKKKEAKTEKVGTKRAKKSESDAEDADKKSKKKSDSEKASSKKKESSDDSKQKKTKSKKKKSDEEDKEEDTE
jgi:large subunit ribosomal protein L30e